MARPRAGKRRDKNRVYCRQLAALGCGVLLCAAVFVLTIIARIGITALSDETARIESQLDQLRLEERNMRAEYERNWSLERIAQAASELGMVPPGEAEEVFIEPPREDITVYFPAYQTEMDEPETIWEYFG